VNVSVSELAGWWFCSTFAIKSGKTNKTINIYCSVLFTAKKYQKALTRFEIQKH